MKIKRIFVIWFIVLFLQSLCFNTVTFAFSNTNSSDNNLDIDNDLIENQEEEFGIKDFLKNSKEYI